MKVNLIPFILALCLLLQIQSLSAHTYTYEYLGVEQGLSNNSVVAMVFDANNQAWIGTVDGLCKYNGYEVTIFRHTDNDSSTLSSNVITCLFVDNAQRLWIGTDEGLHIYDEQHEKFKSIFNKPVLSTYAGIQVRDIEQSANGTMWIATEKGLVTFNYPDFSDVKEYNAQQQQPYFINDNNVNDICRDRSNLIYVATNLGINVIDPIQGVQRIIDEKTAPLRMVTSIAIDQHGNKFFGTFGHGLVVQKTSGEFIQYKSGPSAGKDPPNNIIHSIGPMDEKYAWICTDNGLAKFNINSDSKPFDNDISQPFSKIVLTATKDVHGQIWFGTRFGGINILRNEKNIVSILNRDNTYSNKIKVSGFAEAAPGIIWVATDGDGLYKYYQNKNKVIHHQLNASLPTKKITDVKVDGRELWLATWGDGLIRYDTVSGKMVSYNSKKNPEIAGDQYFDVFITDKYVFGCSYRQGLCIIDKKTRKVKTAVPIVEKTHQQNANSVTSIYEDHQQTFWVGTQLHGLYTYDASLGVLKKATPTTLPQFFNNMIYSIKGLDTNHLLLGTMNGLIIYDKNKNTCQVFDERKGLAGNVVYSLEQQNDTTWWATTSNGLSKVYFTKDNDEFDITTENFHISHGLTSEQFVKGATLRTRDGHMIAGCVNGFSIFNPAELKLNDLPPSIILTSLKINNKLVNANDDHHILTTNLNNTQELHLEYFQNMISIDYVGVSYVHTSLNKYEYMLVPHDEGWIDNNTNRNATYTNLRPGTYTFKVRAANNDGIWMKDAKELIIHIKAAWWQTIVFKIITIITIIVIILLFIQWRISNIQNQKKKLNKLVQKRTSELQKSNDDLRNKKIELEVMNKEVQVQNEEIISQNEEIAAQRDNIKTMNTELQSAQDQLRTVNQQLEVQIKERTEELQKALNDLLVLNGEMDKFLFHSAHDIRGPILQLIGLSKLGLMESDSVIANEYFRRFEKTSVNLSKVLEKLVQATSLFRNQFHFSTITDKDVMKLLNEIGNKFDLGEHIEIITHVNVKHPFMNDYAHLKIIIENLVENATIFRERGKKTIISINVEADENAFNMEIEDNGVGIPKGYEDKIFEMFVRASELSQGSGLGLYLVHSMVKKMHGFINLETERGKRTKFHIILPHPDKV